MKFEEYTMIQKHATDSQRKIYFIYKILEIATDDSNLELPWSEIIIVCCGLLMKSVLDNSTNSEEFNEEVNRTISEINISCADSISSLSFRPALILGLELLTPMIDVLVRHSSELNFNDMEPKWDIVFNTFYKNLIVSLKNFIEIRESKCSG